MREVVGMQYILEVVEEVRDGFTLGIGQDIVVVYFRAACTDMIESARGTAFGSG